MLALNDWNALQSGLKFAGNLYPKSPTLVSVLGHVMVCLTLVNVVFF